MPKQYLWKKHKTKLNNYKQIKQYISKPINQIFTNYKMTTDCVICGEKSTKKNKLITCEKCPFISCSSCVKKYILSKNENPHCMECKFEFTRNYMVTQLGKTFITNDYKNHRENILYQRELSLLQQTQPIVERVVRKEYLIKRGREIDNQIGELAREKINIRNELRDINNGESEKSEIINKNVFVRKCPYGDCRGYLTANSNNLYCGICTNYSCKQCHELIGTTDEDKNKHICDEQNVKSVKAIMKDSKPCPSCSSITHKINGCNHMWCIECKKSWDWNTGLILNTKSPNNPEYFAWLRRNTSNIPRQPQPEELDDNGCRTLSNMVILRILDMKLYIEDPMWIFDDKKNDWIHNKTRKNFDEYSKNNYFGGIDALYRNYKSDEIYYRNKIDILDIIRNINHIREHDLINYNTNDMEYNINIRVQYLRNLISEEQFRERIQRSEKKLLKYGEIHTILSLFITCITDLIHQMPTYKYDIINRVRILNEMESLRSYVNECFVRISKTYSCICYAIHTDYMFSYVDSEKRRKLHTPRKLHIPNETELLEIMGKYEIEKIRDEKNRNGLQIQKEEKYKHKEKKQNLNNNKKIIEKEIILLD